MLVVFQLLQTIGYYGFTSLGARPAAGQGITVTKSLAYTVIIAWPPPCAAPCATQFADVASANGSSLRRRWRSRSLACASRSSKDAAADRDLGLLIAFSNTIFAYSLHAYQSELYLTTDSRPRGRLHLFLEPLQHDLCRLLCRLFPEELRHGGVFLFIASAMIAVIVVIASTGPRTTMLRLEAISR